jgi:hypothetical protein
MNFRLSNAPFKSDVAFSTFRGEGLVSLLMLYHCIIKDKIGREAI